jgi:hypothetical protein
MSSNTSQTFIGDRLLGQQALTSLGDFDKGVLAAATEAPAARNPCFEPSNTLSTAVDDSSVSECIVIAFDVLIARSSEALFFHL